MVLVPLHATPTDQPPPLTPSRLLTEWTWEWSMALGITVAAGLYIAGLVALHRRGDHWPVGRSVSFLLGGLGVGRLDLEIDGFGSAVETGSGAILGLGWDIRVAPNVSLTPFWNGIGIKVTDGDANFGQIGIGLTIH